MGFLNVKGVLSLVTQTVFKADVFRLQNERESERDLILSMRETCVCVRVCVSQGRSQKPQGGLSRETAEIKVGNSHQKHPIWER